MDYETELIDGRKAIVRHFFKAHEIQVGSRWARADGSKVYEMLFEGTEDQCRQYAYENYTDKEYYQMCLMDWEAREWEV
jgi:monomeric isocitrate dehydrogenase